MTQIGLVLSKVRIAIGSRTLIDQLDLSIGAGEIVTLMGPSGSGKSSLISFICGALAPGFEASGCIFLNGSQMVDLPIEKRRIGVLFQDDLLFPHMTVAQNLAFGVPQALSRVERRARVQAALAEAELDGFEDRDPMTLSGGQRARIALMRALLSEPQALLLDEPFSRLDSGLRVRIRDFTFSAIERYQIPALLVTHDPEDGSERIVHMR